jgi:hypothetical protein
MHVTWLFLSTGFNFRETAKEERANVSAKQKHCDANVPKPDDPSRFELTPSGFNGRGHSFISQIKTKHLGHGPLSAQNS